MKMNNLPGWVRADIEWQCQRVDRVSDDPEGRDASLFHLRAAVTMLAEMCLLAPDLRCIQEALSDIDDALKVIVRGRTNLNPDADDLCIGQYRTGLWNRVRGNQYAAASNAFSGTEAFSGKGEFRHWELANISKHRFLAMLQP